MSVIKILIDNFQPIIKDFYEIIKKPIFIILWFLLLPFVSVIIFINIVIGFLNFFVLMLSLLKNIILTKIFKNKQKIIFYKSKINWVKNSYIIFILYQIFEVPRKYSFFFFYNFIYTLKNFNKKKIDLKNIKVLLINILIRYLFIILTSIPILVIKANNKIIKKIILINNYNFVNNNAYFSTICYNIMKNSTLDIDLYIKKLKIKIENNQIILNLSHNKYLKFKKLGEYLIKPEKFSKSTSMLNEDMVIGMLGLTKNDLKLDVNNNKCHYKIPIVKHLSLFFKSKNGKIYYVNETTKKSIFVWNKQNNQLEEHLLKYQHKGSLNDNLESWYTNIMKINAENTELQPVNANIQEIINNEDTSLNLSANFILQINEKMFTQKIDNNINNKTAIITEYDNNYNSFEDELKHNKDLFPDNIINAVNESKEFFLLNENIFNELYDDEKIEFMENVVKLYDKLDYCKNITFYSNFK